ncbi:MAG: glucosyltransferase domain-containing protein [Phascolarctobacterium sp.]|uniref:glucosyltransferase domain-containing protein n=1 Tax=Phascolarctobacterium sp. TaxID=2049039 RepID=UPI0026DDA1EB|nr:glucosyltransferase domain-containing protein [Phascolarctobacterium sp.]MDO4920664.1 glucosyltransferase domain-containing protein [Phascolarctobacterium sp.]
MNSIKINLAEISAKYSKEIRTFFVLLFLYGLSMISIIRANYNYIDDLGRTAFGYRGWAGFSRFISEYLSVFVHTTRELNDISPLPQILAVIIMALASTFLIHIVSSIRGFCYWSIAAVLPLGLSPYFLECLSYKFDSPYMALSVLASIFPLLFMDKGIKIYSTMVILGTLIMCMTYQVSSGIFLLCTMFVVALKWGNGHKFTDCIKSLIISGVNFLIGIIIFRKILMNPVHTYVSTDIADKNSFFDIVSRNIITYFSILEQDSVRLWIILFITICFSFVVSYVINSVRPKYKTILMASVLLVVGGMFSYGGYIILQKPLFAPRGMYGFGVFVALVGLSAINCWHKNILAKLSCLGLSWALLVFSFTYGNVLAEQKRYTDFRTQLVLSDLSKLPDLNNAHLRKMQLRGNIGKSPIVNRMAAKYKVLNRLVPKTLGAGWHWSEFYLYHYFSLPGVQQLPGWSKEQPDNIPVIFDSCYHTIKANDKYILVELK